jgi:hypothetical protein
MTGVLEILAVLCGIVALVCFIVVVYQMFQNDETTLAIVTIVLVFCGIGGLVAFIYGWIKASEWDIKPVMLIYTASLIGGIVFRVMAAAA